MEERHGAIYRIKICLGRRAHLTQEGEDIKESIVSRSGKDISRMGGRGKWTMPKINSLKLRTAELGLGTKPSA